MAEQADRSVVSVPLFTGLLLIVAAFALACGQPDDEPASIQARSASPTPFITATIEPPIRPSSTSATSVSQGAAASPTAALVFPTQPPLSAHMEALIVGRLFDADGCLWLETEYGSYGVVWPHGYSWRDVGDGIEVLDEEGIVVARTGDEVQMGGGEAGAGDAGCLGAGKIWIAAPGVQTTEQAAIPTPTPPPPDIPFPRVATPSSGSAELVGILTMTDGCVRVNASDGSGSYLVIWPPGVAPHDDIGALVLDDGSNLQVGSMGVQHYRGWLGAELYLTGEPVDSLPATLPMEGSAGDCPGPYWMSGPDVRLAEFVSIDGQPPRLDPNDGTLAGVIQYATDLELTLAEANRRLLLQDAIGMLNGTLQANEPATFDVLYVQHEPEYRVIIKVKPNKPDAESIIEEYIAGGPLEGMVNIRVSTWTEEDLSAHRAEATRILEEFGIHHTSMTDVRTERVEIMVVDLAEAEAALQEAGVSLPETVVLIEVEP